MLWVATAVESYMENQVSHVSGVRGKGEMVYAREVRMT